MTHKKKFIIITISISLAVAIAVTFITLACTIWKPKTTQEWLNDFKNCLVMNKDTSEQKTEKSIVITEDGKEVARYYQIVEIKNQNNGTVAHLSVTEEFPTLETQEFDTYDEYYFIDGRMYMQRTVMEETNGTSFASSWDVFWEVVSENLGSVNYNFSENVFSDLVISHNNGVHSFTATISDENKIIFFAGAENLGDMSNINISMSMDDSLTYCECKITYTYKNTQFVELKTVKSEPTEIEIKDFVRG